MKRNDKIKILGSILVIIIIIALIFNRLLIQLKDSLDETFLPMQSKVYTFSEKVMEVEKVVFSYGEVIKENEALKAENLKLKFINLNNNIVSEENKRLAELLKMKSSDKTLADLKVARVIFRDADSINNKFFIDLGSKDGIEKNMIAIYNEFLVGRVVKVKENYSEVTMITNSISNVSARTVENNLVGIAKGSDERAGELYFEPLTFQEKVPKNEEVVTSGISDIYPAGLKIGKIFEADEHNRDIFKNIKIKVGFNPKDLREVIVYKYKGNFKKER